MKGHIDKSGHCLWNDGERGVVRPFFRDRRHCLSDQYDQEAKPAQTSFRFLMVRGVWDLRILLTNLIIS